MEQGERVGRVRWTILAMLFAVTVINYADRATLSLAAPTLMHDLGIDKFQLHPGAILRDRSMRSDHGLDRPRFWMAMGFRGDGRRGPARRSRLDANGL